LCDDRIAAVSAIENRLKMAYASAMICQVLTDAAEKPGAGAGN
jgi:hypothetical protein